MTAFCVDCRTALRAAGVCDPHHRVVDLGTEFGRSLLAREASQPVLAEAPSPTPFRTLLAIIDPYAVAAVLLLIGLVLTYTGRPFWGFITGLCAMSAVALGVGRKKRGHAFTPSSRPIEHRPIAARAEPPWNEAPQQLVGKIVAAIGTPSPFGGDSCAGWALETSFAGIGIMLRDGETGGMSVTLDDGRALTVPASMLRLARRASSDDLDSDAVAAHVGSLASPDLIVWDEARAVVLHVGDRVELVASIADRTEAHYREVDEPTLTTTDVPLVRRV